MAASIHDFALDYAERFKWAVFPCFGKRPAISRSEGGSGCLDASSDPSVVESVWRRYPRANIGIATGSTSGFWVLDIDGEEGRASLAALEREHGPLPDTLRQVTGSGGKHYLFAYDRPVRNRTGFLPGLDVRGDGGYIIAAPSIHPDSGNQYRWIGSPGDMPVAAAPDWLLALVIVERAVTQEPPDTPAKPPVEGHWGPKPAYSRAALERACETIARAPVGQQECTLNREAYSIGRLIASGYMPCGLAFELLEWAALQMPNGNGKRPWGRSEVREKITRAFLAAQKTPRSPAQGRAA